jgi:hypothetical protein
MHTKRNAKMRAKRNTGVRQSPSSPRGCGGTLNLAGSSMMVRDPQMHKGPNGFFLDELKRLVLSD